MFALLLAASLGQCVNGVCRTVTYAPPVPVASYQAAYVAAPAVAVVRRPVVVHERRGLFRGRKAILATRGCR